MHSSYTGCTFTPWVSLWWRFIDCRSCGGFAVSYIARKDSWGACLNAWVSVWWSVYWLQRLLWLCCYIYCEEGQLRCLPEYLSVCVWWKVLALQKLWWLSCFIYWEEQLRFLSEYLCQCGEVSRDCKGCGGFAVSQFGGGTVELSAGTFSSYFTSSLSLGNIIS